MIPQPTTGALSAIRLAQANHGHSSIHQITSSRRPVSRTSCWARIWGACEGVCLKRFRMLRMGLDVCGLGDALQYMYALWGTRALLRGLWGHWLKRFRVLHIWCDCYFKAVKAVSVWRRCWRQWWFLFAAVKLKSYWIRFLFQGCAVCAALLGKSEKLRDLWGVLFSVCCSVFLPRIFSRAMAPALKSNDAYDTSPCCSVLQCVALWCCSVLLCDVAQFCSVLQPRNLSRAGAPSKNNDPCDSSMACFIHLRRCCSVMQCCSVLLHSSTT